MDRIKYSCRRIAFFPRHSSPGFVPTCFVVVLFLLSAGCGSSRQPKTDRQVAGYSSSLPKLGYTIQVGAFRELDNALRLTEDLRRQGIEAYHFVHPSGLYKVRFGNYPSFSSAREKAALLLADGAILEFYIVKPEDLQAALDVHDAETHLRRNIIRTARRFIGVPYKWGGTSPDEGFDCSGLAMVVYRLNGLDLPRTSREQYRSGRLIQKKALKPGDLVFFRTGWRRRVSHVGIYTGNNSFIHAPTHGRSITATPMSNDYFATRFVGARSYF